MTLTRLAAARRLVVKVGSALVTNNGAGLDLGAIEGWARQIATLRQQGKEVVLVSSGAIACGMQRLGWAKRPKSVHELQAAAAVGQMGLAQVYDSAFAQTDALLGSHAYLGINVGARHLRSVQFVDTLLQRLAPYFEDGGHMIDQAWQPRLAEGMVRAYLVRERVAGFGHQAINALYPAAAGAPAPSPGPRLYSDPDDPRFQDLRRRLEQEWVRMLCSRVDVSPDQLPLLWDADFLLGEREGEAERYALCEINVSSVSPFPPSAIPRLVDALFRFRPGAQR